MSHTLSSGEAASSLDRMPRGARARLGQPQVASPEVVRLTELGMTPGTEIEVLRRAPFGGPMQLRVRDSRLCVRLVDARLFPVEALPGKAPA